MNPLVQKMGLFSFLIPHGGGAAYESNRGIKIVGKANQSIVLMNYIFKKDLSNIKKIIEEKAKLK